MMNLYLTFDNSPDEKSIPKMRKERVRSGRNYFWKHFEIAYNTVFDKASK